MGNLFSVQKAFEHLGAEVIVTSDPAAVRSADVLVVPGVGEFGAAMNEFHKRGLYKPVADHVKKGNKFLGICLGMQLTLDESEESPGVRGFGFIPGRVKKFPAEKKMPVPQIGWNTVKQISNLKSQISDLWNGIKDDSYFYFVHSYYADPADSSVIAGETEYGVTYASVVLKNNVVAMQFHPEKSQDNGLRLLKNFLEM
jgi:imidazole glycerol phosphate synthase glutamine amidotransferase subunit